MSQSFAFNGVHARRGGYLIPATDAVALAALAQGRPAKGPEFEAFRKQVSRARVGNFAPAEGVDPKDLAQTGWGVVFPAVEPGSPAARHQAAVREALEPLLRLRAEQARARDERCYREFIGETAWQPGDTKRSFLARHGAGFGPTMAERVPYYLLLVGAPGIIDFRSQYLLDVQYAVGRLHFETPAEYARYADSVVAAETGGLALPRGLGLFGVGNADDTATRLSAAHLVAPLAEWAQRDLTGWRVDHVAPDGAHKARLAAMMGGAQTPALLFTASHGVAFDSGDAMQRPFQGALLCGDWPGPQAWRGELRRDFYLGGEDLGSDARLHGLVAFHFACFGAGTPVHDEFSKRQFADAPERLAPAPMLAALPQRMLAHPKGGALAVIGHVDRAWGYSFLWKDGDRRGRQRRQVEVFRSTLARLTGGYPVGAAMEYLNVRYAELACELTTVLQDQEDLGLEPDPFELAGLWTAHNDARGYAVLGDPAVRVMVDPEGPGAPRAALELKTRAPEEPMADTPDDPETVAAPADADFGWFSKKEGDDEPGMFARFAQKVTETLSDALQDALTLEVRTFVADDVAAAAARPRAELAEVAELKAYTRFHMDGDLDLLVPRTDGRVDEALWAVHREMVKQAQTHRQEMLRTLISVVTGKGSGKS